jgi:ABC-2 type transport system ATP-binding protein
MVKELAIATRGLTKQFDRHIAVNDVDLEIGLGEVYGLIGPNGAGKTTLIRMLATAEEPTIGQIFINGERLLRDQQNAHLKQWIGYLPDDFPMYDDLTVWDYLDYFARLYQLRDPHRTRRIYEVLELVQLTSKRNSVISSLSRGMKQRLGLARTIIHHPIMLLLDEPVSGLDPIARVQFRDIIKMLQAAGITILISSHVLSDLAEICTAIGIMELGFLVESAPLADLYQKLSQQYLLISTLGDRTSLLHRLNHHPHIEHYTTLLDGNIQIQFSGTAEDSAELLRSLITDGFPITRFHPVQENLESIFLKLGHRQAS